LISIGHDYRSTIYHLTIYRCAIDTLAVRDPDSYLPLPQTQFHVLVSLTAGERHGYAIMQDVEASSNGLVRMGPATLYGTLKRLVDDGLAEELPHRQAADDDQRRRYYRLTGLGQRVCAAEADRLAGLVRITRANLRAGTT
jgi:DNA-binding PadR family transcriptional regulator